MDALHVSAVTFDLTRLNLCLTLALAVSHGLTLLLTLLVDPLKYSSLDAGQRNRELLKEAENILDIQLQLRELLSSSLMSVVSDEQVRDPAVKSAALGNLEALKFNVSAPNSNSS